MLGCEAEAEHIQPASQSPGEVKLAPIPPRHGLKPQQEDVSRVQC